MTADGDYGRCPTCQPWKWYPLPPHELPSASPDALGDGLPFIASSEWFGDGCQAFHLLLFCRDLAHALVALDPRTWSIEESSLRACPGCPGWPFGVV